MSVPTDAVDVEMFPIATDNFTYQSHATSVELEAGSLHSVRQPRPEAGPWLYFSAKMTIKRVEVPPPKKETPWHFVNYKCRCGGVEILAYECWPEPDASFGGAGSRACDGLCELYTGTDTAHAVVATLANVGTRVECKPGAAGLGNH